MFKHIHECFVFTIRQLYIHCHGTQYISITITGMYTQFTNNLSQFAIRLFPSSHAIWAIAIRAPHHPCKVTFPYMKTLHNTRLVRVQGSTTHEAAGCSTPVLSDLRLMHNAICFQVEQHLTACRHISRHWRGRWGSLLNPGCSRMVSRQSE